MQPEASTISVSRAEAEALMRALALGLVIGLSFCSPADAWGELGHKIVCEIAYRLATPAARSEVRRLIDVDTTKWTFSDSCTWADNPRKRATEHYVNLARNQATITSLSCPFGPCVLAAIDSDRKKLADKTKSDGQRLAALKFLGHWVGDIHQPVHVSLRGDSGGNAIGVFGECTFDFHDTWDTCLVQKAVQGKDVRDAATDIINSIPPGMQDQWKQGGTLEWANESFKITRAPTTKYCIQQGTFCNKPTADVNVDADYVKDHTPVVRERLIQAGVRLAHLLNQAVGQ
jgi:hypothetical protein